MPQMIKHTTHINSSADADAFAFDNIHTLYTIGDNPEKLAYTAEKFPLHNEGHILTLVATTKAMNSARFCEKIETHMKQRGILDIKTAAYYRLILKEAITNAIDHGNLGLASDHKESISADNWFKYFKDEKNSKLADPHLANKTITIHIYLQNGQLVTSVKDQGRGFDHAHIVAEKRMEIESDTCNTKPYGMGITLMLQLADTLVYEDVGRQVVFTVQALNYACPATPALAKPETIKSSARILIVDDEEATRLQLELYLKDDGYKNVFTAHNGAKALDMAAHIKPDIIYMDIMMPGMDGFDTCRALKQNPDTQDIPILFISGMTTARYKAQGYQLGAVDYIDKPFDRLEFLARTQVRLQNRMLLKSCRDNSNYLRQELQKARLFQQSLLPQKASLEALGNKHGLDIQHNFTSCEELAGDYFNVREVGKHHIAITLADFTGHGLSSGMNTVWLHAIMTELHHLIMHPAEMAFYLNTMLHKMLDVEAFATFFYGVLNTATGEMNYVGCGCPLPLIIQPKKHSFITLDTTGYPLGVIASQKKNFQEHSCKIAQNEILFFYSDALLETVHTDNNRRMSLDALTRVLSRLLKDEPHLLLDNLRRDFYKTAQLPLQDDLTLLLLQRNTA